MRMAETEKTERATMMDPLMVRLAVVVGLAWGTAGCDPPREAGRATTGYGAVRQIEAQYVALEQRAARLRDIAGDSTAAERLRIETARMTLEITALQGAFESMTAALSTEQLSSILSDWERIALAQAGLSLLREDAVALQADPRLTGAEVRGLADALTAVAGFAAHSGRTAKARLAVRHRVV